MIDETERLEIFYRVSDRLPWTLLGEITATKMIANVNKRIDQEGVVPVPEQRYQFTKLPNGDALPSFNEIQFKFKSYNGFSIIGAWFEYDYITRQTLK